jgi:hypothetical protein
MTENYALKITISGYIKSGKSLMAAFIAEKLSQAGVSIEWGDDSLGLWQAIDRKRNLLDDRGATISSVTPRVKIETLQLQTRPKEKT